MTNRTLSPLDRLLVEIERGLGTMFDAQPIATRPSPADALAINAGTDMLSDDERRHAAGLMRVNHVGEVCAQALYFGQAAVARSDTLRAHLLHAANEETDHLAWCGERLRELDSRPSLLNPLWYGGAYAIGAAAGLIGDGLSLGFVVETERQVEAHLDGHLTALPAGDERSRAIVRQMKADEAQHAAQAQNAGARELPAPLPGLMRFAANVMRAVAYRV
ncbi:MAG: 2-polyprenyl-3-methyl-6-methoxy-1,4-benzoquinone monooxygenase [Dokdonella sp.]